MKHASKIITLGSALIVAGTCVQAQTIADWTFQSDTIAVNNNPAADVGSGTASSIGMATYATPNVGVTTDDVLAGKNSDTGANGLADLGRSGVFVRRPAPMARPTAGPVWRRS